MRIGIDLLWVRVGKCGGTESYIRNLLQGIRQIDEENEYILFVSADNAESFERYTNARISLNICPVESSNRFRRILWENSKLDKLAMDLSIERMFIPVYSMPDKESNIKYITVIHDLQAIHYPQYFSAIKLFFTKRKWRYACKNADKLITISDYCKNDIIEHFPESKGKITTIYNPIISEESELDFNVIREKYNIAKNEYLYTVSSLLPHKNLDTLLKAMALLSDEIKEKCPVLVVSGVGGAEKEFMEEVRGLGIESKVRLTGFVSNEERDCLYANCRLFVFPSIFEGFGMPPIEAMRRGKVCITTRESSLFEVTRGLARYVDNPLDEECFKEAICKEMNNFDKPEPIPFEEYELENVTRKYIEVITGPIEID